jgi:divalent metal cation (Fe/Co/Zn/Cd) transporter
VEPGHSTPLAPGNRQLLHARAVRLGWLTVSWNVIEAVVAVGAGIIAGSVALIGFGVDSGIEVISAVGLLWRLRRAGPDAEVGEESAAEKRALYVVAVTFFLLAAYIGYEAIRALLDRDGPLTSPVGVVLSILSLVVMPVLSYAKQRTGQQMGSRALVADAKETWVCSYLSLTLLIGVGAFALFGWWWADPVGALAMLPVIFWQGWETLGEARDHGHDGWPADDGIREISARPDA